MRGKSGLRYLQLVLASVTRQHFKNIPQRHVVTIVPIQAFGCSGVQLTLFAHGAAIFLGQPIYQRVYTPLKDLRKLKCSGHG